MEVNIKRILNLTLDTHKLIWYLDKSLNNKLSVNAIGMIAMAEEEGSINIPVIVLVEILYLIEKNRIKLKFNDLLKKLEKNDAYNIVPLDVSILEEFEKLKGLEAHDRIILATAKVTKTLLVSKDEMLRNNYKGVFW